MAAVVFAYHNMGCMGIRALLEKDVAISAVFTYSNNPLENCWFESVEDLCRENNIRYFLDVDLKEPKWEELIREIAPDVIWSFYYRSLIPMRILSLAKYSALNLHGSLLPKYRGRCPVNWQIINGETTAGITLHHMEAGADTGDIVAQSAVEISEEDTALTLFKKLESAGKDLLLKNIPAVMNNTAPQTAQDSSRATVFGGRGPEDGRILPAMTSREVYDLVRAVTRPYPGAFIEQNNEKKIIWQCKKIDTVPDTTAPAGTCFTAKGKEYIKTSDGALLITDASPKT